ncbi:MAG: alpha/beta fold hydrolase [Bosea sp. (in: a-proteobacteria)]
MSVPPIPTFEIFSVSGFALECGVVLPEARLAFRQRGRIGAGEPVLMCTAFASNPLGLAYLGAEDGPLPEDRHWLIDVELMGNGRSSSPSNTPHPHGGAEFPKLTIRDNIALQKALLDHLGVTRVTAVIGASMGGQQALQWAVSHPGMVGRAICIAGNARTTLFGQMFLNVVASALRSDPAFNEGHYTSQPILGLSRLSEAWAPFALSPRFFSEGRHQAHADMAADDLTGFLAKWRTRYHAKDANDLLCHLDMWATNDISGTPGCEGSFATAASRATMPVLFAQISTDIYFHPRDAADQAVFFTQATVEVVQSLSGHAAAFGREPEDRETIRALVGRFLAG